MKVKSIVTAMMMAGAFGAGAVTVSESGVTSSRPSFKLEPVTKSAKVKTKNIQRLGTVDKKAQAEYLRDKAHSGTKRYIIRLVDKPVSTYRGEVSGYPATNLSSKKGVLGDVAFDAKSQEAQQYASYLDKKQNEFVQKAANSTGASVKSLRSLKYAINGLVAELSFEDAKKISQMSEVAFVEQDQLLHIETDYSPSFIGATDVFDGSATGMAHMGEGTIIGIIDTGVNTDHRSFAATGDDGYTVANPWGDGVYVGDCEVEASLCNSKLIGVRSYSAVTDAYSDPMFDETRPAYGEDYNGHGSHTGSTAGGNVLLDVPLYSSDPDGGIVSDGIAGAFTFTQMSGIAPHANIISYQICLPGNSGDTYSGCYSAAGIGAIDDAIADGVDVLNYSIGGSTPFSPWESATELGFLNAQAAGIFVAVSAGNSGPNPETTTKVAPWYTSVAASTHGRAVGLGVELDGNTYIYTTSQGPALPATLTAPVVYAGAVDAANIEGCSAFAAGSFTGSIALISRGACAFSTKVNNAADAGADMVIVHNNTGGDATIVMGGTAGTPIPSVMVSQNAGAAMVASLTATPGLSATFSDTTFALSFGESDSIASFSSRGRNSFVDIITPQIAAPGVSIYAAYADEQPFFDDPADAAPSDFAFLQGTSMASPHIAGSAALVKSANPTWGPDQIRSALMMTATTDMVKEDGATQASYFDMGAGRVQVDQAVNAGLVMSESIENYTAANPAEGGNVQTLNRPSMANFACNRVCSWTRTFTATTDGTYTFGSSNDLMVASPRTINATAGNNYTVNFALVVENVNTGVALSEEVTITSTNGTSDLHMPVYVKVNNGTTPESVTMNVGQNSGTYSVDGIQSIETDDLRVELNGMFDANAVGSSEEFTFELEEDPTNGEYADDLDQVFVDVFEVPNNTAGINLAITETTSPDMDMFLERDADGDGNFEELVDFSATGATLEAISVVNPGAGTYRAILQNWAGSGGGPDTVTYTREVVAVSDPIPVISVVAPTTADGLTPSDVKLLWDFDLNVGDSYYGDITVSAGSQLIGNFPVVINRVENDVVMAANVESATRGDQIDYTITVNRNQYNDDMAYELSVDLTSGMGLVEGSVVASSGDVTIKDPNAVGLNIVSDFSIAPDSDNNDYRDDLTDGIHLVEFAVPSGTVTLDVVISGSTAPDNDLWVEYDSLGDGSYATLVGFAATGAADEFVNIASPVEGDYRVIVQNWAGSGAAEDTGTVTITTVPATGEGFLFIGDSLQSDHKYTAVSSAVDAECAAAGFGGYIALEDFGIPTIGVSGDTFTETVFDFWTFPHFGEQFFTADREPGINITDDGFVFFSGTSGGSPWAQTSLPNAAEPNDMIALAWQDMDIVDDRDLMDADDIGTRGIRTARVTSAGMAIIEYDEQSLWGNPSPITSISHELFAFNNISDDHDGWGKYEYIVAYAEEQTFLFGYGPTAGVENASGTLGTDATDLIAAGTQICYDFVRGDEIVITFSVSTDADTLGNPISPVVSVESDMANSKAFTVTAPVALTNVAPIANAGPDATYDRATATKNVKLTAGGTVDVDQDRLLFTWTQTAGETVSLSGARSIHAFLSLDDVANGTYTFNLLVDDGEFTSTDEVTITIEGEDPFGSGPMGLMLMLLSLPLFFRRRFVK